MRKWRIEYVKETEKERREEVDVWSGWGEGKEWRSEGVKDVCSSHLLIAVYLRVQAGERGQERHLDRYLTWCIKKENIPSLHFLISFLFYFIPNLFLRVFFPASVFPFLYGYFPALFSLPLNSHLFLCVFVFIPMSFFFSLSLFYYLPLKHSSSPSLVLSSLYSWLSFSLFFFCLFIF